VSSRPIALEPATATISAGQIRDDDPPLELYRDVTYLPKAPELVFSADDRWGLYDRTGRLIATAAYRRGNPPTIVGQCPDIPLPAVATAPDDLYLYLGPLHFHYGHFLLASLARLWPLLRDEGPRPRLLYHGLDSPSVLFAKPWVAALLGGFRLMPGDLAWFSEPVRIGRVIVPGPSFEEDYLAHRVHARVGQAIAAALPAGSPPAGEVVYFSKARLASGVWRILNEAELDSFLLDRGVTVLYPNRMPLEAQIAALNHASCAISTSNSALHTLLLARPGRRVLGLHLHHLGTNQALIDILCGARADHRRIDEHLIEEQVAEAADPRRRLDTAPGFLRSFRVRDPVALGTAILRLVERSPTARA
jgi:capsular polysaccharide biosynthesis protein